MNAHSFNRLSLPCGSPFFLELVPYELVKWWRLQVKSSRIADPIHSRFESLHIPYEVALSKLAPAHFTVLHTRDIDDIVGLLGTWTWESEDDMEPSESARRISKFK